MYDVTIIGAGIIGLATAYKLIEYEPKLKILLLEKEVDVAMHQTGRNSGVVHAGIYYKAGSLKSEFSKEGLIATTDFCQKNGVDIYKVGKLIVATNDEETSSLHDLYDNALGNGVRIEMLTQCQLARIEPNVNGKAAILSPNTSIVSFRCISQTIARNLRVRGVNFKFNEEVIQINETTSFVEIVTKNNRYRTGRVVVCAGLHSDRLAKMCGINVDFKIVPFKGIYYKLDDRLNNIAKHLIYPVPNSRLPFLGIHLTKMIDGSTTVGPNAVLAAGREAYNSYNYSLNDIGDYLVYPGFWKLLLKYKDTLHSQILETLSKKYYLKQCKKYCPEIELNDLKSYSAGIRSQAVDRNGNLIHDFLVHGTERTIHVCNAPSPAATASLPIANYIYNNYFK